ncbi:hypothetical protein C809_04218 [Lachnospiraceae bacterium MD335]|nr:hypothetical protein C809_04218 [Lachnospiraceae bacterium MD335]
MEMLLLTLYKQHYLDCYNENMNAEFSCLGYYDGLDITTIKQKDKIFPMAEVWNETGNQIKRLKGRFSNQNIGLFRCDDLLGKWNDLEQLPFMAVGFIRVKDSIKASGLYAEIENKSTYGNMRTNKICKVLTYYTFDNADLVVLARGNSIHLLEETLQEIEKMEEIVYLHSILGINETYLKDCESNNSILDKWKGRDCFIDEELHNLNIQLATSGSLSVLALFKSKIAYWRTWGSVEEQNKNRLDNISYSHMLGHGNINIKISNSNVRTLILFLLHGGVLTHQNGVYGKGLYNIETEIFIHENKWKEVDTILTNEYTNDHNNMYDAWCSKIMKDCEMLCGTNSLLSEDIGLYSYFRALIQTLNTLSQYEQFSMSRDIFELIIPSFQMFKQQLIESIGRISSEIPREDIKRSLMQYLECVNSVIYHTIHTDQVYLMIPGYSGTSFSIPIKLSMFYSWYIEKVKNILNDANRKYSCIIKPVMESRPITNIIRIKPKENDMLICVQLAQHSLFRPAELLIILTHEIAHYVNRKCRERLYRRECIIRTLAYYMAEGICGSIDLSNNPVEFGVGISVELIKQIKHDLQIELFTQMKASILSEFSDVEHSSVLAIVLRQVCREVISEDGKGSYICKVIHKIPHKVLSMIDRKEDIAVEQMRLIYKVQKEMDMNRRALISSLTIDKVIQDLIVVYKEVFSDTVASILLECSEEQFTSAFEVSEGMKKDGRCHIKSREHKIRIEMLKKTAFPLKCDNSVDEKNGNGKEETDFLKSLYGNLYNYTWVSSLLLKYAECVRNKLKTYVSEKRKAVNEIREVFATFSKGKNAPEEIYLLIEESIRQHKDNVNNILKNSD